MIVISSLQWVVQHFTTYRFYEGKKGAFGILTHFGEVFYPKTWPVGLRPLEERFGEGRRNSHERSSAVFYKQPLEAIQ